VYACVCTCVCVCARVCVFLCVAKCIVTTIPFQHHLSLTPLTLSTSTSRTINFHLSHYQLTPLTLNTYTSHTINLHVQQCQFAPFSYMSHITNLDLHYIQTNTVWLTLPIELALQLLHIVLHINHDTLLHWFTHSTQPLHFVTLFYT
jgi:hypothetical protein